MIVSRSIDACTYACAGAGSTCQMTSTLPRASPQHRMAARVVYGVVHIQAPVVGMLEMHVREITRAKTAGPTWVSSTG